MTEDSQRANEKHRRKLKLVHIHSDPKFIKEIAKYRTDYFDNVLIILGKKDSSNSQFHDYALFFEEKPSNISKIVKLTFDADLVIINNLTRFKCRIVLEIPKRTKIAWRFFGHELYSRIPQKVLSPSTLRVLREDSRNKNVLYLAAKKLRSTIFRRDILPEAILRLDLFLGLFVEEYNMLKKIWPDLPPFLMLGLRYEKANYVSQDKHKYYIAGNSRNHFNNHIDIIELINEYRDLDYKCKMLFNYGDNGFYADQIRKLVRLSNIELVEDYLPMTDFENLYKHASAMVINSYRQMAMFNTFCAIRNGTKIYLNNQNVTMHWLLTNGFIIKSINDFQQDLRTGNLALSVEEANYNIDRFNDLVRNHSLSEFQSQLYEFAVKERVINGD